MQVTTVPRRSLFEWRDLHESFKKQEETLPTCKCRGVVVLETISFIEVNALPTLGQPRDVFPAIPTVEKPTKISLCRGASFTYLFYGGVALTYFWPS